jgi:sn-glycerol 3-phosphate transport system permease protein
MIRRRGREWRLAALLLLPSLVLFGVFVFYPFANNFRLALFQNPPLPGLPAHYVGLSQVGNVLTSTSFLQSLVSTILFVVMVVPTSIVLGLVLAVVAHRKLRGIGIYRTIFSSTIASSVAVASVIFGTLMDPVVGLLPWLGLSPSTPYLSSPTTALPAIAVLTIWQGLGLAFIVLSAGMQAVPDELLEAAEIDGATPWVRFWRVTVPLLSPMIFFTLVVATIAALQSFGQVDLLIGYQHAAFLHTNVLTYNIYTTLLVQNDPGVAAILSIVLFLLTLGVTLLQLRFLERRVHYAR